MIRMFLLAVAVAWVMVACSYGDDQPYGGAPPSQQQTQDFATVQPIIAANCGPCHGVRPGLPVFDTAAHFSGSAALSELQQGAMPPSPATISADDKAALVAYLQR